MTAKTYVLGLSNASGHAVAETLSITVCSWSNRQHERETLGSAVQACMCLYTQDIFVSFFSVTLSWFQKREVLISCVRIEDGQR